jgi:TonB family protein
MGTRFAVAIAFACLAGQPLAPCARKATQKSDFQPAKAVSISDVAIPLLSVAIGTVVLDVGITKEGEVDDVQVRRDIPSETEAAVRSVRAWKFEPAKCNGRAVPSRVTVAVTFLPRPPIAEDRSSLPPLIHQDHQARPGSSSNPPEVIHAAFPRLPPFHYTLAGTVVLEASIDQAGSVQRTKVLRDVPPFTPTSIQALDDWRFRPASMDGKPVRSKVVLVFCFRQPAGPWPWP